MPDILSQDEIDALLTANDPALRELFEGLKKLKVEEDQYLGFNKFIDSLAQQDKKLGELEPAALNEVKKLLKGKRVSSKVRADLNKNALKALGHKVDEHRKKHEDARPQERIVASYDFKHPARVNKAQLRTLEHLHDNFARLLSSTFSAPTAPSSTSTPPLSTRPPTPNTSCPFPTPPAPTSSPSGRPKGRR